jgi:Erv1 / Alr family
MTKGWGPLGWATLHSVSALYPDNPSALEQEMFARWLVSFTQTILCPSCMKHFSDAVAAYTYMNPTWKSSRRGVVEFVMRAHNSVNSRNHRKMYTFNESIAELETILPPALAPVRRQEYLAYIRNDWMKNMTMEGISTAPKIRELNMIEENYWSKRTFEWYELSVFSDINVSPLVNASSSLTNAGGTLIPRLSMPQSGFKLKTLGRIGPLSNLRS